MGLLCSAAAGAAQLDEYGVKSAFVYNFLQFVDWPAARLGPGDALVVCVVADSPITPKLNALETRQVKGHSLEVRTLAPASDFGGCHAVFVPGGTTARGAALAAPNREAGLLVISENQETAAASAVISLAVVDNRIAFDINLDLAAGQGLRLSSKLIRLARRVQGGDASMRREGER
jgi:hypothetical protein